MNEEAFFSTPVNVLVSHQNYGNHLGYDAVLSLLQEARLRWLKTIRADLTEVNIEDGVGWLVKEVHLTYDWEAFHGDELLIELCIGETTKTTLTLEYAVENKTTNKRVCFATTKLVFYHFESSKVARVPVGLLAAMSS